jgi:hypothetical protein
LISATGTIEQVYLVNEHRLYPAEQVVDRSAFDGEAITH